MTTARAPDRVHGQMATDRRSNDAERATWRNFLLAHGRLVARLDSDLTAECDMSLAEYEVLVHLGEAEDGRLRMNELAERARLSPSGLTRRFDALVRRGWAVRERCDDDRRGVMARLTEEGRTQLERAHPVHARGEREYFLDVLPPNQVALIGDLMAKIAEANDPADLERAS